MKKTLIAIVTIVLLLMSLASVALAASYVYFSGDCNVRSGPGLGYSTLGSVNHGSTLDYTGRTRYDDRGVAWYSVPFGGQEGWVSSVYASFTDHGGIATYGDGGSNNRGLTQDFYSNSYSNNYSSSNAGKYYNSVRAIGDANVRMGPGLNYASIGVLHSGSRVDYAGDSCYDNRGVAWYAVYWGHQCAWVSSVYTTFY